MYEISFSSRGEDIESYIDDVISYSVCGNILKCYRTDGVTTIFPIEAYIEISIKEISRPRIE